ncbi:hypothetical protein DFH27DRAFT_191026 [Peziza echinospora]|nr:hypothetical protein DFH27DRAFT_191026 [Peziza echinospora]
MNENYPWQESPGYHFGGKVSIVGYDLTPGQEPAIKVDFNIHTSKAEMKDMIRLIKGEDGEGVVLYTDYSDRQLIKPLGCATIQATIAIPKGKGAAGLATIPTILSNLDIAVETLCISMDSASLELTVSDKTSLKTLCGGITYSNASIPIDRPFMPGGPGAFGAAPSALPAPSEPFVDTFRLAKSGFSSRLFHAKTQTGAIMAVPLVIFDEVDVETTTGNIRLEYDAASEPNASALAPANINVRSVSGNVYLESPPPSADITSIRRTATTVITTSGKVSGSILLPPSSELTIGSFSGDISPLEVLVLPASSTHFNTDTKTGLTNIRLLETGGDLIEPIEQSGVVIVKGRHNSFSGEIEVSYPQRWQGSILARTLDGRITMRGEGVSIVSENGGAEKSAEVFRRELLEKRPTEEEVKEAESQNGGDIAEEEDDDIATPFSVPPISSGLWKTVRGHKAPTPTSPTPPSSDVRVVSVSGNIEFLVGLRRKSWVEKGRERVERLKSWLSLAAEKSGCSRFRDALIRGDGPFGGPRKPSMPPGPPIMPPGGHERQHSSSR